MSEKKFVLEEAMARLENIVAQLENDKLPLEESLKLYEEAIKLSLKCSGELEKAKRKIQILQEGKEGEIVLSDVPEGMFSDSGEN